ncbi:MAG: DUF3883 domain-containing protein [Bacteroidales bacterium]|nr:DUF3883 domain-containing protein [Bacteroidales bacterium]
MRKELKRYSSIGNRAGILLLCKKILTGQLEDLPSIEVSCTFINGVDLNFKCGIIAFEEIKLISIVNQKCLAQSLFYSEQNESLFINQLCRFCINALIDMDMINVANIKYNEIKDCFQIPKYAFKMECSVYRNLLITFGALIQDDIFFTVNDGFESDFSKFISKKRHISQAQLLENLEKEQFIGEKGEEFVLNFEKKRCPFSVNQKRKIKRISVIDASAGFDIQSFEDEISENKRFIEVKTYSGRIHFYWSANEIRAARLRGASYFIYLVDFNKIECQGYVPIIIPNPYLNIKDKSIWDMQPSSFEVTTKMQEDELKKCIPLG